ncbi:unnamed protein product [Ilex paraguariensis]|uniref:Fe2OG dioxygenase domain-containing protein n=1 Tax=Ilex paraguariensis TaxID=185542 RepID=A0ABC8TSH5_9AQUA
MDPKSIRLGGSLEVPFVRELAREQLGTVPPRYVRPVQDHPIISDNSSLPQVPIIDLQSLLSGDSKDLELEKLHRACKEWSFFQLINHEVSSSLVDKLKIEIQEFFKLPVEEKKKFGQEPGDIEGFGQAFVVSEEQKLDWADMFYIVTLPTYLRKPQLLPKFPAPFSPWLENQPLKVSFVTHSLPAGRSITTLRDTMEAHSIEVKNLAMNILTFIAKALKMEVGDTRVLFEEGMQGMRINYYPPCPQPESVIGLTPHSDSGGLTILLQVSEIEGLQIKKDGIWIPVVPLPNAFTVNIGDILEIVTNGIYRSIEHRAVVNSKKERLSVAAFLSPKLDGDLGPAPSLINEQTPALFKRIGVADFFRGYYSRKLEGKSYLDIMRIEKDGQKY